MCPSVCVSVIVKIKKTSVGVCGARRLENKNYSGFQNNSEFVMTYAGVRFVRTIRNNNYSYDVPLGRPESGILIIRTVEASTGFRNQILSRT